ncbi:MAG: ribonuclease HII [Clostridium sp.]
MTKQERIQKITEETNRLKEYDNNISSVILGIDEVGRGPLAGPVVVTGVIMKADSCIIGVRDSKKTTEKQRKELFAKIKEDIVHSHTVFISPEEIDHLNIEKATKKGMEEVISVLGKKAEVILVDGNDKLNITDAEIIPKVRSIVKGDDNSYTIACASIYAKVIRDEYMRKQDTLYNGYEFSAHKGYGTKKHIEAIQKLGPCKLHRKTFIKNFVGGLK